MYTQAGHERNTQSRATDPELAMRPGFHSTCVLTLCVFPTAQTLSMELSPSRHESAHRRTALPAP